MDSIRIFFRGNPSDYSFKTFGLEHLMIIVVGFIGIMILKSLKDNGINTGPIIKVLAGGLILQQGILYLWYMKSGYFTLQESLPLYNCRIAALSLGLGYFLKKKTILNLGVYWGFMGSIIALLTPALDPFGPDHVTFYSFFIGHLFLLWASFYFIYVENLNRSYKTVRNVVLFSTSYHLVVMFFNLRIDANYCYLYESPIFTSYFRELNKSLYSIGVIILFDLMLLANHHLTNKISSFNKMEDVSVEEIYL